jgi:hypothetical protein
MNAVAIILLAVALFAVLTVLAYILGSALGRSAALYDDELARAKSGLPPRL